MNHSMGFGVPKVLTFLPKLSVLLQLTFQSLTLTQTTPGREFSFILVWFCTEIHSTFLQRINFFLLCHTKESINLQGKALCTSHIFFPQTGPEGISSSSSLSPLSAQGQVHNRFAGIWELPALVNVPSCLLEFSWKPQHFLRMKCNLKIPNAFHRDVKIPTMQILKKIPKGNCLK